MGYLDSAFGPKPTLVVTLRADAEEAVDANAWICPDLGCKYQLLSVEEVHSVVGGAAAAVMPEKATGTTAPASGTDLLTAALDLTASVETVRNGTLTATESARVFAPGDRIVLDFSGTVAGLAGCIIQFVLVPIEAVV